MFEIDARKVLEMTYDEMVKIPHQLVKVKFDDGVLLAGWRATIYSHYLWEFHRRYPKTPLLMKHHIGNKRFTKKTTLKTGNECLWSTYDAYNHPGETVEVETLTELFYRINNKIFNDTKNIEEYITTLGPEDFIEILDHEEISQINAGVQPNPLSIGSAYKGITAVLKDEHHLSRNWLAKAVKSDLVKIGQALQCVGPRGFLTDLDSHQFQHPILDSYAGGIYSAHDCGIESRSGAKSLIYNKELIKDTEYFNREMQLLCHPMMGLVQGDCGTTRTLPFYIADMKHLRGMDGKYYVGEDGQLKTIHHWDKHLIGKKVMLRAVSCCETKQRGYICTTCYGDLALSVPKQTNLGHVAATEVGGKITQRVLSNKHLDQSSMIEQIVLDDFERRFMQVMGKDGSKLGLADEIAKLPVKLTFARECTPYLADIKAVDEIPEHALPRYSQITDVTFNVHHKNGQTESATVGVAVSSRIGYFTAPFLKHIKHVGWSLTPEGNYEISLDGWDVKRPIFALPMKQMNMMDFKLEVEGMLKRSKAYPAGKNSPDLSNPQVMSDEIGAFFDLLNKRIDANFAHVEVMIQATLIVSEEGRDYRIPHPWETREFGRYTDILRFRSLSGALAYEKQADTLNNPASFLVKQRQSHSYDAYLRV